MTAEILKNLETGLLVTPVPEVIACSFILLTSLFFVVAKPQYFSNKQQASLLSLVYSFALVLGSFPFIFKLIINHGNLDWVEQPSDFGRGLIALFLTGLCLDLFLGYLYYPDQLNILTGWIHHIGYILLIIYVLINDYSEYFGLMCLMELPTFVLSLGTIAPRFRSDAVFGITFFTTRILYHLYSAVSWYFLAPYPKAYLVLLSVLPLHLFWFRGYILQQQRLRRGSPRQTEADSLLASSETISPGSSKLMYISVKSNA